VQCGYRAWRPRPPDAPVEATLRPAPVRPTSGSPSASTAGARKKASTTISLAIPPMIANPNPGSPAFTTSYTVNSTASLISTPTPGTWSTLATSRRRPGCPRRRPHRMQAVNTRPLSGRRHQERRRPRRRPTGGHPGAKRTGDLIRSAIRSPSPAWRSSSPSTSGFGHRLPGNDPDVGRTGVEMEALTPSRSRC